MLLWQGHERTVEKSTVSIKFNGAICGDPPGNRTRDTLIKRIKGVNCMQENLDWIDTSILNDDADD